MTISGYIGTLPVPRATRALLQGVVTSPTTRRITMAGGYQSSNLIIYIDGRRIGSNKYFATDGLNIDFTFDLPNSTRYIVEEYTHASTPSVADNPSLIHVVRRNYNIRFTIDLLDPVKTSPDLIQLDDQFNSLFFDQTARSGSGGSWVVVSTAALSPDVAPGINSDGNFYIPNGVNYIRLSPVHSVNGTIVANKSQSLVLRLLSGYNNQLVFTSGFFTPGDQKGGLLMWDNNVGKGQHDGVMIIDPNRLVDAGSGPWPDYEFYEPEGDGTGCWVYITRPAKRWSISSDLYAMHHRIDCQASRGSNLYGDIQADTVGFIGGLLKSNLMSDTSTITGLIYQIHDSSSELRSASTNISGNARRICTVGGVLISDAVSTSGDMHFAYDLNMDRYSITQGVSLDLTTSELQANDESHDQEMIATITWVGNEAHGSATLDGESISFIPTGLAYSPAYFEYDIENELAVANGKVFINITALPDVSALLFLNGVDRDTSLSSYQPPTTAEIFSTWPRFHNNLYYEDASVATGDSAAWTFLTDPDRFVQPNNVGSHCGIVSPEKLDNFTFEATLTSTNGDDDSIGLVIAYVRDVDVNRVLVAVRTKAGTPPNQTWGVLLLENNTIVWIMHNIAIGDPVGGWSNNQTRVKIVRNGDLISCYTTDWNNVGVYEPSSEISIDLTSDPRLAVFRGPASYGYYTLSQAESTYLDISLVGGIDYGQTLDADTGDVLELIDGVWTPTGISIQDSVGYISKVFNPTTDQRFLVTDTSIDYLGIIVEKDQLSGDSILNQSQIVIINSINNSMGAGSGVVIAGLFEPDFEEHNIMSGRGVFGTNSAHSYYVDPIYGNVGYNDINSSTFLKDWILPNGIPITYKSLVGGMIVFGNGVVGTIRHVESVNANITRVYYNATTSFVLYDKNKLFTSPTYSINGAQGYNIYSYSTDTEYYGVTSRSNVEGVEANMALIDVYYNIELDQWSLFIVLDTVENLASGQMRVDLTNLPSGTTIQLSDDAGELIMVDENTARGTWYWGGENTDGGILRFPSRESVVDVTLTSTDPLTTITHWKYRTSDTEYGYIDVAQQLVISLQE